MIRTPEKDHFGEPFDVLYLNGKSYLTLEGKTIIRHPTQCRRIIVEGREGWGVEVEFLYLRSRREKRVTHLSRVGCPSITPGHK